LLGARVQASMAQGRQDCVGQPHVPGRQRAPDHRPDLGETGPLSQGVQARKKALRTRHINGIKVRKKRPRGFKKKPRGCK
jgi:hypothetical protein